MSIISEFLQTASANRDRTAIVDTQKDWTYREVEEKTSQLAPVVRRKTERPNVGLLLPTGAAHAISYLACQLAGRVPVPINFLQDSGQLQHIVKDAALDLVITCSTLEPLAKALGLPCLQWEAIPFDDLPTCDEVEDAADHDLATILYTSGTTGVPKGVMLTQKNLTSNVAGCIHAMGISEPDTFIGFLPLFHSFGMTATMLLPLLSGSRVAFLDKFHPGAVAEGIGRHRVTVLLAIPSMYRFLVRAAGRNEHDFSSLRLCVSGGEPLEDSLAEDFQDAFDFPLLNGYGLTETSPVVAINDPRRPKPGSIGPPLPGQEARIAGEDGTALAPGHDGELWLRGPNIMKGYYNLPEETAAVLDEEGWFRTGDQAKIDEEGYIYITGRIKDLIKSSGEFIAPFELERCMAQHPAVHEVAVIGVPDRSRGEVPKAYVALKPGADCTAEELMKLCRGQLARFKVPRSVEFREELPHGPTGKVLKRQLKEEPAG